MDQHIDQPFGGRDAREAALEAVQEMAQTAWSKRLVNGMEMTGGLDPEGDLLVQIVMDAIEDEMARVRRAPGTVVGCGERFDEGDVREAVGRFLCDTEHQYQEELGRRHE